MLKRIAMFMVPCMALSSSHFFAQPSDDLNFLSELADFQDIRSMLPSYLKRKAAERLDIRQHKIESFASKQDVAARKAYLREKMLHALGGFPARTPLNAKVVSTLERDDYKIEKVIFESQPRFFVTANLYLPKKGKPPYPGILFPLGHERRAKANPTWQQMLVTLARKGFVALAWDPIGQGERSQFYDPDLGEPKMASTTEHTILGIQCLLVGDNVARYTVWDGLRALDYLLSRKEVDPAQIGCTGNSGGGTHTAYLSALDDRIHVAAPSCYLTSWRRLLATIGPQDAEQCLPPWLLDGLDHADFIYAFAPKPYLILSAIRDFFSISGARETFEEARRIYKLMDAEEKLGMFEADDGHGYSEPRRHAAYRWFTRWLKGREDREPERTVEPESEEALNCTASGQVATSLEGESVYSLNQQRLEQARQQRPRLVGFHDLEAYRQEMRRHVLDRIGFEIPDVKGAKPSLSVKPYGELVRSGYRIEKLTYESEPGIIVPGLLFIPEGGQPRKSAILYVHGQGKSAEAEPGRDIEQLVKQDCVVLSIDLRGMGETQIPRNPEMASEFFRFFGDSDSAMTALLLGKTLVGMRIRDLWHGTNFLESRPEVDTQRIYGFGKEAGSVPLLFASVLDERISRTALEGLLLSYESVVTYRIHRRVFENVVPHALKFFDFPELIAAIAPRPVWLVDAVDPLGHRVRQSEVLKLYARSIDAYKLAGAEGSIQIRERGIDEPASKVYRELIGNR